MRDAFVDATRRRGRKYSEYALAVSRENAAARATRDVGRTRREVAEAFDPQGTDTVLDYATTAYPSKRGEKMGLRCPVFNVRVRAEQNTVRAYAIRNDGQVMGVVKAYLRTAEVNGRELASVGWSSLLQGGESLDFGKGGSTDFRGCGVGPRLYEAIAAFACNNDLTMTSDETLYPNSRAFWERQQEKGRASYDTELGRFVVDDACNIKRTGMRGLTIKSTRKSRKRRKG
jgi:hypothetical protein